MTPLDPETFADIAERHRAGLTLQFGSTVNGHAHPGSDVDIGVLFDRRPPGQDHRRFLELERAHVRRTLARA